MAVVGNGRMNMRGELFFFFFGGGKGEDALGGEIWLFELISSTQPDLA